MPRIELITAPAELPPGPRAVADRVVETRGEVSRPFQVLLHAPVFAERVAELGDVVRSGSTLADADRELATLATGAAVGCGFVWTSHLGAAAAVGLSEQTIAALRNDRAGLGPREATIAAFVDELCTTGAVSANTFASAHELLGTPGLVELATTVGYYTMLARVMSAFEAC